VTDDVLAMARPNTAQIVKKDIIAQFQGWSIKTIINLQTPGEHASCGDPLEESGFTYDPNIFMKNNSKFRIYRIYRIFFRSLIYSYLFLSSRIILENIDYDVLKNFHKNKSNMKSYK